LAKKFNCTPQELIDANPEAVKGEGESRYFLAGAEIKIPKELDADDKALQGRAGKEETIQEYSNYMAAKAAQEAAKAQATQESAASEEAAETDSAQNEGTAENASQKRPSSEELKAKQREAEAISTDIYNACSAKRIRAVDHKDFQTALKKITSENASMVISQHNAKHPQESIVDLICSEKTSSNDARKEALLHIMTQLANEARAKGVPEADIKKHENEFKISMEAEFKKFGVIDPKKMETSLKALHGLVLSKDVDAVEMTDAEAMESITNTASGEYDNAKGQFDKARQEEGWTAKTGDTVLGIFGYITKEDMEGKLSAYKGDIEKLQNCKTEAEFKKVYEDVFGIPYDKKKIEAYEGAKIELQYATSFKNNADALQNLYSEARGRDYDSYRALVAQTLPEFDEKAIDDIVNAQAEEYMKAHPHSDKKDVLRNFIDQYKQQQLQMYNEFTKGRTLEQMNAEVDSIRQSAFGTKDIVNDVVKYNQNQEMTGMAVEMAGEIAATAVLQAIPGLGQAAAARLAISAAKWGVRGAKMLNYAEKAGGAFKKINTAMNATKKARIAANTGAAFAGTTAVDLTNGKSVKEALKKGLQNATFAGAGAFSSEMTQVLTKTYGISNKVAKEIAEEITERTLDVMTSAGVSAAMIGEYTSTDAFMDIATGVIMGRLGKKGLKEAGNDTPANVQNGTPTPKPQVETPTQKPQAEAPAPKPQVEAPEPKPQTETPTPEAGEVPSSPAAKPSTEQVETKPADDTAPTGAKDSTPQAEPTQSGKAEKSNTADTLEKIHSEISKIGQRLADKASAIKDIEIPQQYKELWANCKKEFSELTSKLPSGEEMLQKCKTLYTNLKQISSTLTGAAKQQFDSLLEDIKAMAQRAKASINLQTAKGGFKPVTSVKEAEKLYDKLVKKRFIGDASPEDGKPIFWSPNGWAQAMYKTNHPQGTPWKMHIYANSPQEWANVAQLAMPYLNKNEVVYKTVTDLDEHFQTLRETVNSEGAHSQTGKAFTIYFENEEQFLQVAKDLDKIFAESGLTSSGKAMNEAQIGESGFLSYRHEGSERGTQYKPDDIEDPYLNSLGNQTRTEGVNSDGVHTSDDNLPTAEAELINDAAPAATAKPETTPAAQKPNTEENTSSGVKPEDDTPIAEAVPVDESTPIENVDNVVEVEIKPEPSPAQIKADMVNIAQGIQNAKTPRQVSKLQEMINALPDSQQKTILQSQLDAKVQVLKNIERSQTDMSPEMRYMMEAEKIKQENIAKITAAYPDIHPKFAENIADLLEMKADISEKLMNIITGSERDLGDLHAIVTIATPDNIDDLVKLSKNTNLGTIFDTNGYAVGNDFEQVIKLADSNPEIREKIIDLAAATGDNYANIHNGVSFLKKYPQNADDIVTLLSSNKHIKTGYDLDGIQAPDIDNVMKAITADPELKDDIMNFMSVQRKSAWDTTSSTKQLDKFVYALKKFPNQKDVINTLSKNPNLDGADINVIMHEYGSNPQLLDDVLKLSSKGYTELSISTKIEAMEHNPKLREAYLSDSSEFTLIDKNPANTPSEVIQKRFDTRDKLEADFSAELQTLKNTLGDEYFAKVQWEEIIPPNTSQSEIKAILDDLNDSSKFFARTTVNERNYGKNIKWASEMNNISNAASTRITEGESFDTVIRDIAQDYKAYDECTTLGSNVNESDRRRFSGVYRGKYNDGGASTPFDKTGSYQEYYDRFSKMLADANNGIERPKPYPDVELTNFATIDRGDCMIHPRSRTVEPGMKHIGERYDELKPLVEKVKNGGTLTDTEIASAHEKIAEMYYIMGNIMPWARGSNGISDIFMRSMYKSLGIDQPALKRGVSLDLEAFCMPMKEYKEKWNSFFETPVTTAKNNTAADTTPSAQSAAADKPSQKPTAEDDVTILSVEKNDEPEVIYINDDDVIAEPVDVIAEVEEIPTLRDEDMIAEPYNEFSSLDDEIKELEKSIKKDKKKAISQIKDLVIEQGGNVAKHVIENSNLSPETKEFLNNLIDGIDDANDFYNLSNSIADGDFENAMENMAGWMNDEYDLNPSIDDGSLPFDDNMIM